MKIFWWVKKNQNNILYQLAEQRKQQNLSSQEYLIEIKEKLKNAQVDNENLKAALVNSAEARKTLSDNLTEINTKYINILKQFNEQSLLNNELENEVNELRKYKAAVEFGHAHEEEAIRIARARYTYEDQAKVFYEALLMKKADFARVNRQLKYKDLEIEDLQKKILIFKKQIEDATARKNSKDDLVEKLDSTEQLAAQRVQHKNSPSYIKEFVSEKEIAPSKLGSFPMEQKKSPSLPTYTSGTFYIKKRINK